MEEEIDLRPYVEALIKRWYWIVAAAFIGGLLAYLTASFIPPTYEATAMVAVIAPRDVVQLDPRIREIAESQPLRAFPQLAESDQVLQILLEKGIITGAKTVDHLKGVLQAEAGDDLSIIKLLATSPDPEQATRLANAWAEVFVDWANDIYTNRSSNQVNFFEEQLAESEKALSVADEEMVSYQAINRTQVLSNTLEAHLLTHAIYLENQQQVELLTQNSQRLREQLVSQTNGDQVALTDQLTFMLLQLKTFDVGGGVPIQLQLTENLDLSTADRAEQIALLDLLLQTLSAQSVQIENELTTLEPQILELQQQVQSAEVEFRQLSLNRTVAAETYLALARKVEEERITSADTNSGVRLASEASVPQQPAGPRKLIMTIIVAVLVFWGAILIIVARVWWRNYQPLNKPSPSRLDIEQEAPQN